MKLEEHCGCGAWVIVETDPEFVHQAHDELAEWRRGHKHEVRVKPSLGWWDYAPSDTSGASWSGPRPIVGQTP